ncbi:MAG TPA: membrane dipeptidase [Candidatus Dormibacteraeota bacterium]|nr:membrane dipeptidase [Candidatus Dormibacteraeota bacterium]
MSATRTAGYRSYEYLRAGIDYREFDLAPEVGRVPAYATTLSPAQRDHARRLVEESIVISLHDHPAVFPLRIEESVEYNRAGRQVTGFSGLALSGMTAVFDNFMDGTCCITSAMGWKWTDVLHDLGMRLCDLAHQDGVFVARSVDDIIDAHRTSRLALVAGLEAATMIENELDRIDILYGFGVRQMGIAYSEANALGGGLRERNDGGLTDFGRRAVERMNRLGMAIDISHSGDRTSHDVIESSTRPVLITHAGSRTVWDSPRMKPDGVIVACARRGGVIGLEAAPHTTISEAHPAHSLESVMDHFRHCVELVGIEHVAFGPDTLFGDHVGLHSAFAAQLSIATVQSGPFFERVDYVDGMENPAENFTNIAGWLVAHNYSDDDIRAVIGGNVLRVLGEIW